MLKRIAGVAMSALVAATLACGTANVPAATVPAPSAAPAAEAAADKGAYLFVHFVGSEGYDEEQVYFSVSEDGYAWHTLNEKKPVFKSTVGEQGIRDPFIMKKQDGGYVIIATDLSIYNLVQQGKDAWSYCQSDGSKNLVVWESEDLLDWGAPNLVEVAVDNAGCTWAPEAIWDPEVEQYMVFWASRIKDEGKQRVYRAYTPDFKKFSEPEVYIENDDSRIDTTIVEEDGVYYRFTKNEGGSAKWVYMEKSTSLSGPFKYVNSYTLNDEPYYKTGQQDGTPYEGPTAYKLNDGTGWNLLLDNYDYKPFHTDDLASGKFTSAGAFSFGGLRFRHGSVLPITKAQYDALVAKWPLAPEDEPDKTTGELIYSLDFEENLNAGEGTVQTAATAMGSGLTYIDGYNGGKAIQFSSDAKSNVHLPGTIFADLDSFTISFAAKIPDVKTPNDGDKHVNWLFLVEKDTSGCTWQNERYLGILWEHGDAEKNAPQEIVAQRFNVPKGGNRPTVPHKDLGSQAFDTWVHITVVYGKFETKLFINGELAETLGTEVALKSLLGSSPIAYLGHATWGNGEYSNAAMDCFRVYNYTMPDSEVKTNYEAIAPKA